MVHQKYTSHIYIHAVYIYSLWTTGSSLVNTRPSPVSRRFLRGSDNKTMPLLSSISSTAYLGTASRRHSQVCCLATPYTAVVSIISRMARSVWPVHCTRYIAHVRDSKQIATLHPHTAAVVLAPRVLCEALDYRLSTESSTNDQHIHTCVLAARRSKKKRVPVCGGTGDIVPVRHNTASFLSERVHVSRMTAGRGGNQAREGFSVAHTRTVLAAAATTGVGISGSLETPQKVYIYICMHVYTSYIRRWVYGVATLTMCCGEMNDHETIHYSITIIRLEASSAARTADPF